jgi:hypothetical protein
MKNVFIGIDNGIGGGIAIIKGEEVRVIKMPSYKIDGRGHYDIPIIIELFTDLITNSYPSGIMVGLEKAQPRFRDGSKQAFMTGKGYGLMIGLLEALGLDYEIIPPKEWQQSMFGRKKVEDTKVESIQCCNDLHPNVSLLATERSRVPHDGMADALCIAEYMRLQNGN